MRLPHQFPDPPKYCVFIRRKRPVAVPASTADTEKKSGYENCMDAYRSFERRIQAIAKRRDLQLATLGNN